jgi:hypothetical protein
MIGYDRYNQRREDGLSSSLQFAKAGEHLACVVLLLQGYNAFLVDAGLPYDLLIDLGGGKFGRVQVKSTCKMMGPRLDLIGRKRFTRVYRFSLRAGKKGDRKISGRHCDYFAFVALDQKIVAFMKYNDVVKQNGICKTGIEFKSKNADNSRKVNVGPDPEKIGKFIEDYLIFKI